MYIPRGNLDRRFNSNIKFLEQKYNVAISFEYVGVDFVAHVFNLDNLEDNKKFILGNNETTKERLYINLSRSLKGEFAKL